VPARPLTVLHLAPHPDDEATGAPATLLALVGKGHRVINLACSLGAADERRRRREVELACERAGFELVVHRPPLRISDDDDRAAAQRRLTATVRRLVEAERVDVVVSPSPHDGHHGHEVVGRAARDAVHAFGAQAPRLWFWGLWADLPRPTLYFGFDRAALERAITVLEAHEGELARNDYRSLMRGRAAANRTLGSERVFGWGSAMRPQPYAELLMEAILRDDQWWSGRARDLDPAWPLREPRLEAGRRSVPISWWLYGRSFADETGRRR
jgi:LmbE family N-acetylglucosaminyl deacetylase